MGRCASKVLVVTLAVCGCQQSSTPAPSDGVPHVNGPIHIDGDWDEPDWGQRAIRAQFLGDDGQLARPSSELRLLRDDGDLLVALYAADENIVSSDAFELAVGGLALHVDVTGRVTPAVTGLRAAAGYDEGTLDKPDDDDEEWVVELAIPLRAVGGTAKTPVPIHASRCDVPKDGVRRCGSWTGTEIISR